MLSERTLRTFFGRATSAVRSRIVHTDTRLLVALVSVSGILAWVLPWQGTAVFLLAALVITTTAAHELREGRAVLAAYGLFVLLWTVSQFLLSLLERPGEYDAAAAQALLLGARLFTLLGLALAVPLAATPLMLGRTLAWYLRWPVKLESRICAVVFRGRVRPVLAGKVWRIAFALSLMMAFFPRSLRAMKDIRRSLLMRAPHLAPHRKLALMGLALLRVVSAQTWDMTLAIAARGVYRPEPWEWRCE